MFWLGLFRFLLSETVDGSTVGGSAEAQKLTRQQLTEVSRARNVSSSLEYSLLTQFVALLSTAYKKSSFWANVSREDIIAESVKFPSSPFVNSSRFIPANSTMGTHAMTNIKAALAASANETIDQTWTPTEKTLIILAGTILSLVTTGGNTLVMLSFKIDRNLQIISNYFLFSLAVADLAIGIISCPLMTFYTATGEWTLGYIACQFWLSVDYLMSNASVWNLLLISLDRYFSVTRPLTYRPRRTTKKALTMIASTYILSLVLWPPWIISWPYIEGRFAVESNECIVQFLKTNPAVTIGTIIAAFYLPVTIMVILYARVYYATRQRQKELKSLQAYHRKSYRKSLIDKAKKHQSELDSHNNLRDLTDPSVKVSLTKRVLRRLGLCRPETAGPPLSASQLSTKLNGSLSDESSDYTLDDLSTTGGVGLGSTSDSTLPAEIRSPPLANQQAAIPLLDKSARNDRLTGPRKSSVLARSRTPSAVPSEPDASYSVLIQLPKDNSESGDPKILLINQSSSDSGAGRRSKQSGELVRPKTSRGRLGNSDQYHSAMDLSNCLMAVDAMPRTASARHHHSTVRSTNVGRAARLYAEIKQSKREAKAQGKQESKAAKTLSAILLAFILTWAPYSIIVCIGAFRPGLISETWFTFSYYLCYINSTVNPILYALCNANFRRTYLRILQCKFSTPNKAPKNRHVSVFMK